MHSFGIRPSDTMLIASGYGPHCFAWGVHFALNRMNVGMVPGGGMTSDMRAMIIDRFKPTVLTCTPSYARHLGRVMEEKGQDPAKSSKTCGAAGLWNFMAAPNPRPTAAAIPARRRTKGMAP